MTPLTYGLLGGMLIIGVFVALTIHYSKDGPPPPKK